jgi:hypothetical protein
LGIHKNTKKPHETKYCKYLIQGKSDTMNTINIQWRNIFKGIDWKAVWVVYPLAIKMENHSMELEQIIGLEAYSFSKKPVYTVDFVVLPWKTRKSWGLGGAPWF